MAEQTTDKEVEQKENGGKKNRNRPIISIPKKKLYFIFILIVIELALILLI
jgi:hypothetical protein